MLHRLDLRGALGAPGPERLRQLKETLPRPAIAGDPPVAAVRSIIDRVRTEGDAAVRELTKKFDKAEPEAIAVPRVEMENALRDIPPLLREALEQSAESVLAYQRHTKPDDSRYEKDGLVVRDAWKPVDRAGCYVPGGLAEYPSSVIMSAVPARVAGVPEVVLCVPPMPDGHVPQSVLAAAAIAQVDEVYAIGGAQAIAAMAYGTESVKATDVIVGPGNIYVATAKREVASSGTVGIPSSFAGPSEVVVIADETTHSDLAAIDVVVQAEHGPDGLAWLITWSEETADRVNEAVAAIVARSPRREEIEKTFDGGGYAVIVDDATAAMDVANIIAPEHLEIMTVDPEALLPMVQHAGAVFLGTNAPASVGDYMAGPSHVLPVYGSARFSSALGVRDFLRHQHIVTLDDGALARVTPHVAAIADAEGLDAHARSVRMRAHP